MFRSKSINQRFMVLILTIIPVNHQLQSSQSATTREVEAQLLTSTPTKFSSFANPGFSSNPQQVYQNIKNKLLSQAIKRGNIQDVDTAITNGAELNPPYNPNAPTVSPLIQAVNKGNLAIVNLLLTKGAYPNTTGQFGDTALLEAAANNNPEIVQALLDAGADPQIAADASTLSTPLHMAAANGSASIIQALLAKNKNPYLLNAIDNEEKTPLILAEEYAKDTGDTAAFDALIGARASRESKFFGRVNLDTTKPETQRQLLQIRQNHLQKLIEQERTNFLKELLEKQHRESFINLFNEQKAAREALQQQARTEKDLL